MPKTKGKKNVKQLADRENERGRPSIEYSTEFAKKICDTIAASAYGLERICRENPWMPSKTTLYDWNVKYLEFSEMYARAREIRTHNLSEENINIAENFAEEANEKKVSMVRFLAIKQVLDERRWNMAKLATKRYGDKPEDPEGASGKVINININKMPSKS